MPYELLSTETLFSGRAVTIRRDTVRLPDGRQTRLEIVDHRGSVVLVPVDEKGDLLFVRQYRHATGLDLLELPAGTLEAGEAPEACARREIREETGMAAGKLEHLGSFYLAPGYSSEYMHVYLATELRPDPLQADDDEFLSVEGHSFEEAMKMASRGGLPDAKSLAALLLAHSRLAK